MTDRLTGIVTPLLTPYGDDFAIEQRLYHEHAAWCLAQGAHYLSPFGTTGEAVTNTAAERMATLEGLVLSGVVQPAQLMPGTGLCSLSETRELTAHAGALGVTAAMVLPPFFYPAGDDGLYRYYATLIETLGANCPKIILYNIPQNTGVPLSPALAHRLNTDFPQIVVAYKDSSGDWKNTQAVIKDAPGISVFPASETLLSKALKLGAGGCISASCNTNLVAIRACYDALMNGDPKAAKAVQPGLEAHRDAVVKAGLIGALKSIKAHVSGDPRWLNMRAPLLNADAAMGSELAATVG